MLVGRTEKPSIARRVPEGVFTLLRRGCYRCHGYLLCSKGRRKWAHSEIVRTSLWVTGVSMCGVSDAVEKITNILLGIESIRFFLVRIIMIVLASLLLIVLFA